MKSLIENQNYLKRTDAGTIVDIMSELEEGDKRELIGYAKCLHFQTSTNNKNSKSDAVHIQ